MAMSDYFADSRNQYWVGRDGNVYIRTPNGGTVNAGTATGSNVAYRNAVGNGIRAQKINNPGNPQTGGGGPATGSGGPAPASTGGGGGAAATTGLTELDRAGINATQQNINALGPLLAAALAGETTKYGNTVGGFNAQETQQRGTYDKSTVTNQQNYDANMMDSIRAGIKGYAGLKSILRGTGAGGGTAEDWAGETVQNVAAKDIRTGLDTQKENQASLDGSLGAFLTELQRKRQEAADTFENNKRAVSRDNASQLQDLYQKMAGFFSGAGDTGSAAGWVQRAAGLTPTIAANSQAKVSAYNTTPVAVQAPEIAAFAKPTENSVVSSEGGSGQIGSGIFTLGERRRKAEEALPIAPLGA